jgi:DNA-directed RNA polymerase specialized sigma24 family protein
VQERGSVLDGSVKAVPEAKPHHDDPPPGDFEAFFAENEPRLRRALVAAYGNERGREATAEALAWACEHWSRMADVEHPVAYLFTVGRSRTRPRRRRWLVGRPEPGADRPVEPGLAAALAALSEQQRVVVVLVHGYGWTHQEVADLLGVTRSTVQQHLERGLARLRAELEVTDG